MNGFHKITHLIRTFLGKILGFLSDIEHLNQEIRELSWDKTFNMYNSAGLFRKCKNIPPGEIYGVAFVDLDCLHHLNNIYGYDEVNKKIKATFDIKKGQGDFIGRIFSGDEIFVAGAGGLERLKILLKRITIQGRDHKISFRSSIRIWETGSCDIKTLLDEMGRELLRIKKRQMQVGNRIAIGA